MFEDSSQYFFGTFEISSRDRPDLLNLRLEGKARPAEQGLRLLILGYLAFGAAEGLLRLANSQPILPFSSVNAASNGRPFFEMNPRNTSLLPVASILCIWSAGISRRRIALLILKVQDRFATFSQT